MPLSGTIGPRTAPVGTAEAPAPYRPNVNGGGPSASAGFMPGGQPTTPVAPAPPVQGQPGQPGQAPQRKSALDSLTETGEPAGTPGQEPDLAARIAAAARSDRVARDQRRAAKAEREALQAERARVQARAEQLEQQAQADVQRRAEYQRDPSKLLQDHGWQPETALQYMVQGQKLTTEQQVAQLQAELSQAKTLTQKELADLEARTAQALADREAEEARQAQEQQQSQAQMAVEAMKGDIAEVIAGDQNLKLVRTAGQNGVNAVFSRIEAWSDRVAAQTGRRPLITTKVIEAAVFDVESEGREELRTTVLSDPDLLRDMGVLPGNTRLAPPAPRTLANAMPPAPTQRQVEQQRRETEGERRARVVAALEALRVRNGGSLR